MEVWESGERLFKRRAGTPAPILLEAAVQLKGDGQLTYPSNSKDATTGVAPTDKPPYPDGKYEWETYPSGRLLDFSIRMPLPLPWLFTCIKNLCI